MCIIAIKAQGVAPLTEEILKNMFENNPDGAGIAFARRGKIYIEKGLMTQADFLRACEKIKTEDIAVYHARVGTSGGKTPDLTHPFLLCEDFKKMKVLKQRTSTPAVFHNGVFYNLQTRAGVNDTMTFIVNFLKPLQDLSERAGVKLTDESLRPVVERLIENSKIVILEPSKITKYGNFIFDKTTACYFSNDSFKKREPILFDFWDKKDAKSGAGSEKKSSFQMGFFSPAEEKKGSFCATKKDFEDAGKWQNITTLKDIEDLKKEDTDFCYFLKKYKNRYSEREIYAFYMMGLLE